MTTFDKREEGFEKKFALDEEQRFKASARRNRLLGGWIAEQLGMTGERAASYAREVVTGFAASGDADMLRKLLDDLDSKGVPLTEQQIRAKMDEFLALAAAQVKEGK